MHFPILKESKQSIFWTSTLYLLRNNVLQLKPTHNHFSNIALQLRSTRFLIQTQGWK